MSKRLTGLAAAVAIAASFAAVPALACNYGVTAETKPIMTPVNTAELPNEKATLDDSVATSDVVVKKPLPTAPIEE